MRTVLVLIGLLIVLAAGSIWSYEAAMWDTTPPSIHFGSGGAEGSSDLDSQGVVAVAAGDPGGIAELRLTLIQGGKEEILARSEFNPAKPSERIELNLSQHFASAKEGQAVLKVTAVDASFWRNSAESTQVITVDRSRPVVTVRSLQHRAAQGGTEFVIYEAHDSKLAAHGVRVGAQFFPGQPLAATAAPGAVVPEGLFGALFAFPLGSNEKPVLIARDESGNETQVTMSFPVDSKRQRPVDIKLSESFIDSKVRPLSDRYVEFVRNKGEAPPVIPESPIGVFRTVNEGFRHALDARLAEIMEQPATPRVWSDVFIKPMPSATTSTLGELRSYSLNGVDAGKSVHNGLDLASVAGAAVRAANNGKVVLAEDFGIYGNAAVLDHGMGLFSLYGHLSSLSCAVGDMIASGAEIGRTGQTGLAGGDHLHFEFRLRKIPVDPVEWWDAKWIKDNIDGKIAELTAPAPDAGETEAPAVKPGGAQRTAPAKAKKKR